MSKDGPTQLEQAIKEVMPEAAGQILEKYQKVSGALQEAIAGDLIGNSPSEHYRDAKDFIDGLEQSILTADDVSRRAALVHEFADELQYLESSLGLDRSVIAANVEIPKESQPGFAQLLDVAEAEDLLDELPNSEKADLLKTFIESLNISEKQRLNILQVQMIGIMLESIKSNIEEDRTVGEKLSLEEKRPAEIAKMIASLDGAVIKIVSNPSAPLDELISPEIKQLLTHEGVEHHKSFTHTRLIQDGRILEARSMEELQRQYVALLSFLRDNRDYLRAQDLVEKQLLAEHFQDKHKEIPEAELIQMQDKSRQEVEGMVGKHSLREAWRQAGLSTEEQNLFIDKWTDAGLEREKNKWIVKYLGEKPFELNGVESEIFEQYSHIVGINGHIADKDWDFVIDQVLINAPLILAGGVAGLAARTVLNGIVRKVIATGAGAFARAGLAVSQATGRVVATGTLGRGLYLGGRAVGLGLEAAAFETAFLGLQGVNIAELGLSEAMKRIFWTAITLKTFKLVGKQAAEINSLLAKNLTKFPDASVRATIQKLIVTGNFEVAAVFGLGALQYYIEQGSFNDFEFVDQLLHALVAVGALKAAGGILTIGGKKFVPPSKVGKAGNAPRGLETTRRPADMFRRCMDLAAKSPQKLVDTMSKAVDLPLTLKQFGEIIKTLQKNVRNISPDFIFNALEKLRDIGKLATKANVDALIQRFTELLPSQEMVTNFKNFVTRLGPRQLGVFCLFFSPACDALKYDIPLIGTVNLLPGLYLLAEGLSRCAVGNFVLTKIGSIWLNLAGGARMYEAEMRRSLNDSHGRMANVEGQPLQHLLTVNSRVQSYLRRIGELEGDLLPWEAAELRTFRSNVEDAVNDLNTFLHGPAPTRDGVVQRVEIMERMIRNGVEGRRAGWPSWRNQITGYRAMAIVMDIFILLNIAKLSCGKSDEKEKEDKKKADVVKHIDEGKIDEAVDGLLQQKDAPNGGNAPQNYYWPPSKPQDQPTQQPQAPQSDAPAQQPANTPQPASTGRKLKLRF